MVKKKEKRKYNILLKGCAWYKGKSGMPDVSKCKQCFYNLTCLGKNYMNMNIARKFEEI